MFLDTNSTHKKSIAYLCTNNEPMGNEIKSIVAFTMIPNKAKYLDMHLPGAYPLAQWERIHLQCKRHRFNPWVGRSPGGGPGTYSSILAWRTPRTRSLANYSP